MSRQIDVKALVSHIVRGDGADKCRICMGDTSEGQVHLGDTVMLDGDTPVTLAELLETITGVEVALEDDMPVGLCSTCAMSAFHAAEFRSLCRQAACQWNSTLQLLESLPCYHDQGNTLFCIINNNEITVINDVIGGLNTPKSAADRLMVRSTKKEDNQKSIEPKLQKRRREHLRVREVFQERHANSKYHHCQCPDCGKKFTYAQHLYQHLKESTDFKRACFLCAEVMQKDALVEHLINIHNIEPYACMKCPALLRSGKQYLMHLAKAHAHGACTCGDCGRTFKSLHAFNAHQSVHSLKICPGCNKNFRNQTCYLYHIKKCCDLDSSRDDMYRTKNKVTIEVKNRENDKRIKVGLRGSTNKECICDYCGKKFAGKKFVAAHIQIVHMKNTHRPCVYCGKLLAAARMTEHVKKHEQICIYTCEVCGIRLKSKLGYIQHIRLHTGEKPYACRFCGETFSASSRRSEHIRNVHKSSEIVLKHACDFCSARFRLPYRLRKHVATVHNENGNLLLFQCSECPEKFGSCRGLLHHSRKHQEAVITSQKSRENILREFIA